MNATKTDYLYEFKAEVFKRLESSGVDAGHLFSRSPGLRDGMWVNAHAGLARGVSAEQGATAWFDECARPAIARLGTPEPDAFTRAYVAAALWTESDDGDEPLDSEYSIDDIHPDSLAEIMADCAKFQTENAADIAGMREFHNRGEWTHVEQAGHDFLLTRNHHGAGFWDRGMGDLGERLTKATHAYGEIYFYVGDDGKIHC